MKQTEKLKEKLETPMTCLREMLYKIENQRTYCKTEKECIYKEENKRCMRLENQY